MEDQELESILTREMHPWNPKCIMRILKEVKFRWDISEIEQSTTQSIIAEFADCFALSIKEVNAIPGAVHKLNIPEGAVFRTKIPPRSYNPHQ